MKNNIKYILTFTAGSVVGATATYLLIKEKYKQLADDEITSVIETYKRRYDKIFDEVEEDNSGTFVDDEGHLVQTMSHRKFESMTRDYAAKPDLKTVVTEKHYNDAPQDDYADPYVINVEDFGENLVNHEQVTIHYYSGDDTLVDEDESVIFEVEKFVGEDALISFGESDGNPNVVYVRNEQFGIDYEIIRLESCYHQVVLGYDVNGDDIIQKPRRRELDEE